MAKGRSLTTEQLIFLRAHHSEYTAAEFAARFDCSTCYIYILCKGSLVLKKGKPGTIAGKPQPGSLSQVVPPEEKQIIRRPVYQRPPAKYGNGGHLAVLEKYGV